MSNAPFIEEPCTMNHYLLDSRSAIATIKPTANIPASANTGIKRMLSRMSPNDIIKYTKYVSCTTSRDYRFRQLYTAFLYSLRKSSIP